MLYSYLEKLFEVYNEPSKMVAKICSQRLCSLLRRKLIRNLFNSVCLTGNSFAVRFERSPNMVN